MVVSVDEAKGYLRVEYDDDDALIEALINTAESMCLDIVRDEDKTLESISAAKVAVLYAVAYLYEHREEADHTQLMVTLRALLFADRKAGF